jgi:pilus assembly protein CpaF
MILETVVHQVRAELRRHPENDLEEVVERHLGHAAPLLDARSRARFNDQIAAELRGLGPLEPFLADPTVSEVMVNAANDVWIEREGRLLRCGSLGDGQLATAVERIITPLGLRLDRLHPVVDARLPDGSRLCAVAPPVAPDGLSCSIRRFRAERLGLDAFGPPGHAALLERLIEQRCNLVVSGATSSGKTTLLNTLAALIGEDERIVTIEDTAELRIERPHVVRLEARRSATEVEHEITIGHLVRAALRLRPDRLVIGEVRGDEAVDMVQALNTGHDGSFTTCHANSPHDALRRLETMVLIGAPAWPLAAIREQLHSSIDAIVHVARVGGRRSITEIAEVVPLGETEGSGRTRTLADASRVLAVPSRSRR